LFTNFSPAGKFFHKFSQKSRVVGVYTVSDTSVAVGVPAVASIVVGVSTVAVGVPAIAGLPSAPDACDVFIIFAAVSSPEPMIGKGRSPEPRIR
jgi:hypothetical protein